MNASHQPGGPRLRSIRGTVLSILVLAAALFLWFWNSGIYHRHLPRLSVAVEVLGLRGTTVANDDGLHFQVMKDYGWGPRFRWNEANRPAYHFGLVLNLLGLTVACQPYTHYDSDFIVPPNAAVGIPYWLLITASAFGILRFTGLSGWLAPYCRFGVAAWVVMAAIALVFLILNWIPEVDHGSARTYDPGVKGSERVLWWVQVLFDPASFGNIALYYGFPFCWIERGYMNAQPVDLYYGAEMDFRPHKLAECLGVALVAMLVCGMVVELVRRVLIVRRA